MYIAICSQTVVITINKRIVNNINELLLTKTNSLLIITEVVANLFQQILQAITPILPKNVFLGKCLIKLLNINNLHYRNILHPNFSVYIVQKALKY